MKDETCVSGPIDGKCRSRDEWPAHSSPDRAIGELAEGQHGVVSRRQLRCLGLSEDGIEGRLRRGALLRVHQGVYAVGHRALTQESRWLAAVLACGKDAVLSHRSAGQLWRLIPRSSTQPEVTRPRKFRERPGIVGHQSPIAADEIEVVGAIVVTSVARTLFDLAAGLKRPHLERAWNEMEIRQLTSRVSVPELTRRYPRRRGVEALRDLLGSRAPAGITRNDFEASFMAFLDAYALPRPLFNATLPVRGRLLEPDCMWRDERLIVELDGRAVHGTGRAFEGDRQRDRILLAEGWRSMRVTWLQLRDEPAAIAADLRALLRGSDRPPTL